MREHWFGGFSVLLAGIAVAVGLVWAAGYLSLRMRYSAVAVGDQVVVLDERTGAVQTFERSKQPPYHYAYVATDSRARARERAEAAAGGRAPAPAKVEGEGD
jgi:hypothetical protein